jgi:hypothetical protein
MYICTEQYWGHNNCQIIIYFGYNKTLQYSTTALFPNKISLIGFQVKKLFGFFFQIFEIGSRSRSYFSALISKQGCQMVCFRTKNPNLGKFWRALEWRMLVYFMPIWNMLWPFGIFNGHLAFIWQFGIFSSALVYCVKNNLATLFKKVKLRANIVYSSYSSSFLLLYFLTCI